MTAAVNPSVSRLDEQADIIRRLEEDIIFGRLPPGERLVEDSLMARYGASRHFVRQALVHLEHTGIVERQKNVGATVRSYTADEVRKIYDVREMLTRQAMLMIPLPASDDLIGRLEALQAQYVSHGKSRDLRGLHDTNDMFHVALLEACGNEYLVRSVQDYMSITLPMRAKTLAEPEGLKLSISQHNLMISLLRGKDNWALSQLCVEHMHGSKVDYLARIASNDIQNG